MISLPSGNPSISPPSVYRSIQISSVVIDTHLLVFLNKAKRSKALNCSKLYFLKLYSKNWFYSSICTCALHATSSRLSFTYFLILHVMLGEQRYCKMTLLLLRLWNLSTFEGVYACVYALWPRRGGLLKRKWG